MAFSDSVEPEISAQRVTDPFRSNYPQRALVIEAFLGIVARDFRSRPPGPQHSTVPRRLWGPPEVLCRRRLLRGVPRFPPPAASPASRTDPRSGARGCGRRAKLKKIWPTAGGKIRR